MDFTTELEATGGTTTGFVVPDEVVEALGGGRRPRVVASVAGHSWRTSIASMGGRFLLGASAAVRDAAGIAAGETHTVTVELDTAPRTVDVPEDLATALAASPTATTAWAALSYSHQRQHVEAVLAAKRPETRERRVATTVERLSAG
ncbi:MAG TPA: YdeI/OmpD-associated family protein [Ornithinibacter sp.]|nr:YdeI/OmpD-associated family protein [Ornithinibacter sp.]